MIDLFPYKFKDINNFIFRDHIPYREGDAESKAYALDTTRRAVEGHWVDDNGTWVWMPPKFFFFTNLGTALIGDGKARHEDYPEPRDNEVITFTYILCCDGFSGFKDDPDFTCNRRIKEIEEGGDFPQKVIDRLKKTCTRKDGTWKKYVEAWDYLTWFYLVENPRPFPLGLPLYENESKDGMFLATRGWGKTYDIAGGDAAHEYWTNGAMYYDDLKKRPKVNLFVGASDSKYVGTFMETARLSFTNVPGVKFGNHPYFTKSSTANWDKERGAVEQLFRKEDGTYSGSGSEFDKAVILPNKPQVVVSTRGKRIYIDEVGLQDNVKAVHAAAADVLKSPQGKFGVFLASGTGGSIAKIVETKYMYTNPSEFDIYTIPNYWVDGSPIGLFGPASYKYDDFKHNGNTDLIAATKYVLAERKRLSGGVKSKETDIRMNNPLEPPEIFLSGTSDWFDRSLNTDRIQVLEEGDKKEWKKKAKVYDLALGKSRSDNLYDIIATPVEGRWNNVVTDWTVQAGKTGEIVVYEPPMGDGREFLPYNNLYKVVLDPKTDLETGESFYDIKVKKGRPQRMLAEDEMFDNIVATAKVKEDGLKKFLMLCLWYKSRGQYERNVSGIPDFFDKYFLKWILQPTPIAYIKDVVPGSKQAQQSGIFITDGLKREGLKLLSKHQKEIVHEDGLGRRFKRAETWYDLALLYEMNFYNDTGNFDSISSMIILMLWEESERVPDESRRAQEDKEVEDAWSDLATTAKRLSYY